MADALQRQHRDLDLVSKRLPVSVILTYHRVGRPTPQTRYRGLYTTPALLKFQVQVLQALGYQFVTMKDLMQANLTSSPHLAVVTFDDGDQSVGDLAAPLLSSMGVPATVYVVTDDVGGRGVVWKEGGDTNPVDLLGWDELASLKNAGWEIGSHSSQHLHLPPRSLAEQSQLLFRSHETLVSKLGRAKYSIAYPFGAFNDDTLIAARYAGFECGVTTKVGLNLTPGSPLTIQRVSMRGYRRHHFVESLWWLRGAAFQITTPSGRAAPSRSCLALLASSFPDFFESVLLLSK